MHTRASAYALALQDGHILLTQLAAFCTRPGHWTLPGGGIDHGEQPMEAVRREAIEETSLVANNLELFFARTFSETSSKGDFMAVQLVYRAEMRGEPRVVEEGGSTAAVAWIPLEEVGALPTVCLLDEVMERLRG